VVILLSNNLSLKYVLEDARSLETFLDTLKKNFSCTTLDEEGSIISIQKEGEKAKLWISFEIDKNLNFKANISIETSEKFAKELIDILGKPMGIRKKGPTILDIANMILSIEAKNYNDLVEKLVKETNLSVGVIERILKDIIALSSRAKTFDNIKQAAETIKKLKQPKEKEEW